MKLRWLKILAGGLLALVLVVIAAVFTLTRTETGAGWVLGGAQGQLDGLAVGGHSGSIHGGLVLRQLVYETPGFSLRADSLSTALRTEWFPFALRIEWLEAENLLYQGFATEDNSAPAGLPESLELPFPLALPGVRLSGITVLDGQGEELFQARTLSGSASLYRQLQLHGLELETAQGNAAAQGQMTLRQPFPLDLHLEAALALPVSEGQEPLLLDLVADARGTLDSLDLGVDGTATPPGFQQHSFTSRSRVSMSELKAELFEISGPDLFARGAGSVQWEEPSARLEGVRLEVPGTGLTVDADLSLNREAQIGGQVAWSGLKWPLRGEATEWISRKGRVDLSGTLDDWAVSGQAALQAAGYPGGQLQFDATGNRGGLEARIKEATALGGRLQGRGTYRWDDGGAFSAELGLENLATESLAPAFPAVLNGELAASGRLEPLGISLDIRRIHGEALGKPVAANGRLELAEGVLRADGLTIESGASRLVLDGFPDDENGLAFSAEVANLGDFLPDGRGLLNASGELFMHSDWPVLNLEASGSDIGWQAIQLSSLTVKHNRQDPAAANAFEILLADVAVGDVRLDRIDAFLSLDADSQALRLHGQSGSGELGAELVGALVDSADSATGWNWSGELRSLELALDDQQNIHLQKPATVDASPGTARLETACLIASQAATACVEADWNVHGGAAAKARIEQLPLDLVSELLGLQLRFSQQASGELQLALPPSGKPSGSADFSISAGALSYPDDPDAILETGDGGLAFTLDEGRLTSGVLDIPFPDQGAIDVDYHIPDITEGLNAELRGTFLVDFSDLDVLSLVIPMADQISGSLMADLEMSGTLGQPYFTGRFDLVDGLLENRASGLRLEGIELSGSLAGNGETRLNGGFRAAEGIGTLEALIDLRDIQEPQFELGISGEKLKLFNSEDLMVVVEPDLSVALRPGAVTIEGVVAVPSALVAPAVIPEQTVSESPDLVIVAGRPSGEEDEPEESTPLSILGGLELVLGDDVTLDLSVADLDVAGAVNFDWQGDVIPVANGSFELLGEILAFGQLLEIAQGNISFPTVPADNPHLNIRAEREIFGNSEVRRAGLLIAGTVRRPVVEPYTDPATNRDRAQTLLVTGSDFNMERGVGAVDIGTYIAPRIFVSYGVGVFDDENILSIRYDIGKGWGVKATSGERQTGVDVSYTLDN